MISPVLDAAFSRWPFLSDRPIDLSRDRLFSRYLAAFAYVMSARFANARFFEVDILLAGRGYRGIEQGALFKVSLISPFASAVGVGRHECNLPGSNTSHLC